jgi:hypothetical protein
MTKEQLLEELAERDLITFDKRTIFISGFEEAFVGVTATRPERVIYDYWKCLDYLVRIEKQDFDEALDLLDDFVDIDWGLYTPIYLKQL